MFKKLSVFLVLFSVVAIPALATDANLMKAVDGTVLADRGDAFLIVGQIVQTLLGLVGVIMMILVMYSGYTWMVSAGDSSKISKAKDTLIAAIVGLVIILGSYIITAFVINAFMSK